MKLCIDNINYIIKDDKVEHLVSELVNSSTRQQRLDTLMYYGESVVDLNKMLVVKCRKMGAGKANLELSGALQTLKQITGIELTGNKI